MKRILDLILTFNMTIKIKMMWLMCNDKPAFFTTWLMCHKMYITEFIFKQTLKSCNVYDHQLKSIIKINTK